MAGYTMTKDEVVARMRRIEGQTRGVTQMVENDRYCIDVLTQIAAINKALQAVAVGLLDEHLRHCVVEAVESGDADERNRKLTEATAAVQRLVRS
jgi:CsoR family transcriptional regulator, copper-sensing transcriptional repressor